MGQAARNELTPRIAHSQQETDRLQMAGVMAVLEVVRTTLTTSGKPVLVLHQIRPGNGSKYIYQMESKDD